MWIRVEDDLLPWMIRGDLHSWNDEAAASVLAPAWHVLVEAPGYVKIDQEWDRLEIVKIGAARGCAPFGATPAAGA